MFVKGPEANLHSVVFLNTCMCVIYSFFFQKYYANQDSEKEFLRLCKQVALKLTVNSLFHCK